MNMEMGPHFYEGEPAITEMARAELLADLASERARIVGENVSNEIADNIELQVMLGRLIECGPEMDPDSRSHLRRMIALWIGTHFEEIEEASLDLSFYEMVMRTLGDELDELSGFEDDLSDLPDLWDLAYQDLVAFENGSD